MLIFLLLIDYAMIIGVYYIDARIGAMIKNIEIQIFNIPP